MTRDELAQKLNGIEYDFDFDVEDVIANESGLVVIYGASDDLLEFEGDIRAEFNAWRGTIIFATTDGISPTVAEPHWDNIGLDELSILPITPCGNIITATWCKENKTGWYVDSNIPHSPFDIMGNGELFCRGIVINTVDLRKVWPKKQGENNEPRRMYVN